MNRLNDLTFKYIGKNKLRTAMTIFTIIISTFVIFSIFCIGFSIDYSKKLSEYEATGPYDAVYVLDDSSAEKLYRASQGKTDDIPNLGKLFFLSQQGAVRTVSDFSFFDKRLLIEGDYPKNYDEVVISAERANNPERYAIDESENKVLKIGDRINFHYFVCVGMTNDELRMQEEKLHKEIEQRAIDKYRNDPEYKYVIERIEKDKNNYEGIVGGLIPYANEEDAHLIADLYEKHTKDIIITKKVVGIYSRNYSGKFDERLFISGVHNNMSEAPSYSLMDMNTLGKGYSFEELLIGQYRAEYGNNEKVYLFPGYEKGEIVVEVSFADKKNLAEQATKLGRFLGSNPVINDKALAAFDPDDSVAAYDTLIRTAVMMVIAAVFAVMVMVIVRNSFNISVNEREKDYGMFRIIGLTRKQIIKMILLEAFFVGAIGIVAGILVGMFADIGLFSYLNNYDSGNEILQTILSGIGRLRFKFSWTALGYTVIYMIVIVGYSMVSPIEKLYRLSPVNALQSKDDIDAKSAERRRQRGGSSPKGIKGNRRRSIRNYPVWYGFKNIKLRRGRFILLVVSMGICVALSVALSSAMRTVISTEFDSQDKPSIPVVGNRTSVDNILRLKDIDKIRDDISGMKGYKKTECFSRRVVYPKFDNENEENIVFDKPLNFIGMSNGYYKLVEDITGEALAESGNDVLNVIMVRQAGDKNGVLPKTGDTVIIAGMNVHIAGEINSVAFETLTKKRFPADQRFEGDTDEYYMIYCMDPEGNIIPDGSIEGDSSSMVSTVQYNTLYIFTDIEQEDGSIEKYLSDEGFLFGDSSFNYRKMRFVKQIINVIIVVIMMIVSINLVNMKSSEVLQRRKEIRLLRNIGFSRRDIRKSVISEGLIVSIYAIIFGIISGAAAAIFIVKGIYSGKGLAGFFDESFMSIRFKMDLMSSLVVGLVIILINLIVEEIALKLIKEAD